MNSCAKEQLGLNCSAQISIKIIHLLCFQKGGYQMESFWIIGMSLGSAGFIFALIAIGRIEKLIKTLKELKILDQDYKSDK